MRMMKVLVATKKSPVNQYLVETYTDGLAEEITALAMVICGKPEQPTPCVLVLSRLDSYLILMENLG